MIVKRETYYCLGNWSSIIGLRLRESLRQINDKGRQICTSYRDQQSADFFFQEDTAVKIILRRDLQTSKEFGVELMMKTLKTKMGKKVAITNSWENNH